jgi:signal recognition particle subunit SRP72
MAPSLKSLSALLAQASIEDHEEVLRAANADIKKSKADVDAQHSKAIALLHLDRFEDALKVFEDVKELQSRAQFEYAYTLYKTGDAAKAVQIAQGSGAKASDRKTQHILAQAVREARVTDGDGELTGAGIPI